MFELELNEPNVRLAQVALTSKNTMKILNTIKPVTRVFTAIDRAESVRAIVNPHGSVIIWPCSNIDAPSAPASQVTRLGCDKFSNQLIKQGYIN